MPTSEDRRRAKAIIVEIVRQSGGELQNKTNLFKAFWKAHVAAAERGHTLSDYPIVRMPRGPGIDDFDTLLLHLLNEAALWSGMRPVGSHQAYVFRVIDETAYADELTEEDRAAIAAGVEFVNRGSAADVSEWSHQQSRSWRNTPDGRRLSPEFDSIPDDEYAARQKRFARLNEAYKEAFG